MIKSQPICAFYSVIVTGLLVTPYYLLYLVWKNLTKDDKPEKEGQKDVKALPLVRDTTKDSKQEVYKTIYDEINNYE